MRALAATAAALTLAALATGCEPMDGSPADFATMPEEGWAYADTLSLEPGLPDSTATGRIAIAVRHTNAYLYRNLWLEVTANPADSTAPDTVNMELCDSYGRWHGTGTGVSYMTTDTLAPRVTLTRGVPVRVRHIMRTDTLHDVEQIGVIFIAD